MRLSQRKHWPTLPTLTVRHHKCSTISWDTPRWPPMSLMPSAGPGREINIHWMRVHCWEFIVWINEHNTNNALWQRTKTSIDDIISDLNMSKRSFTLQYVNWLQNWWVEFSSLIIRENTKVNVSYSELTLKWISGSRYMKRNVLDKSTQFCATNLSVSRLPVKNGTCIWPK